MKILFIHGKEGSPQGEKVQLLRTQHEVLAPAMDTNGAFLEAVALVFDELQGFAPDMVVGSSYGGAVGVELLRLGLWEGPTLLLAPAYKRFRLQRSRPWGFPAEAGPVLVVHGREDDVIPIKDSRELIGSCPPAALLEVTDDHRLTRTVATKKLLDYVERLNNPAPPPSY